MCQCNLQNLGKGLQTTPNELNMRKSASEVTKGTAFLIEVRLLGGNLLLCFVQWQEEDWPQEDCTQVRIRW